MDILHVENNDDDALLLNKAFELTGIRVTIKCVSTGEDALAYLKGEVKYSNKTDYRFPQLVILDLKLFGSDGFEVLKWIRGQLKMASLPVLILSASSLERDFKRAHELGADSYFVKPNDFAELREMCRVMSGITRAHSSPR